MKPKIVMLLMVIAVVVAYLICFKVIVMKMDQRHVILGTAALAGICLYVFGYLFENADSDNSIFEVFLYLTPFSICLLLFNLTLSSFEVQNFWHWVISVTCAGISVAIVAWVAHSNRGKSEDLHYSEPYYSTKPTDNFFVGKIFLFILSLAVLATYTLVFNNSRLPFIGIRVNVNEFALHTISAVTSFSCFIFMLYALGNKKFKKDYLSLTLVITAFASFFLTVLLVNRIDGLGDWILSIFIGAVLTILALVFTRSDDVLENNIRFQE